MDSEYLPLDTRYLDDAPYSTSNLDMVNMLLKKQYILFEVGLCGWYASGMNFQAMIIYTLKKPHIVAPKVKENSKIFEVVKITEPIKEVIETDDRAEYANLLNGGWILLNSTEFIYTTSRAPIIYSLGKL